MRNLLGLSVLVGVLVAVVWVVAGDVTQFEPILEIEPLGIGALLLVALLYALVQGALYNSVLRYFSISLGQLESFGALMLTLFGNYFFPFAGFGVRGVYLNRAHGLGAREYSLSVVGIVVVELTSYAMCGLIATLLLLQPYTVEWLLLVMFFTGVVVTGLFATLLKVPFIHKFGFLDRLNKLLDAWYEICRKPGFRPRLFFFTFLQYLLYTSLFVTAYVVLQIPYSLQEAMLQSSLSDFGFVFKVAPAGAGTYEALVFFVNDISGKDVSQAIMLLLLIRFAMLFWPLVLTPFFIPRFAKRARVSSFRELVRGTVK